MTTVSTSRAILPVSTFRRRAAAVASSGEVEIRVCVNRTCSRQGSREILATLSGLAPPEIAVSSCGCLGRCGSGPNLAVVPPGAIVGHCRAAADAAQLLAEVVGEGFDAARNLDALARRRRGEKELELGNFAEAEVLFSQAIDLEPSGGLHLTYRSRSTARLGMGDKAGALEDAEGAAKINPKYTQAYVSQGDAFIAMEKWNAAEKAYSTALQIDPLLRRSKRFKARIAKLQEKLASVEAS